jgi:ABC-type transport system involved in multi-copper enzyme maturation permease subunit
MLRGKLLWILTAAVTAVQLFQLVIYHLVYGALSLGEAAGDVLYDAQHAFNVGLTNMPGLLGFLAPTIAFGILAGALVCGDFGNRTIQSYLVSGVSRIKAFAAKTLVLWVCGLITVGITLFVTCALSGAMDGFGQPLTGANAGEFAARILFVLFLYLSLMSLNVFFAYWTGRTGAVSGISVALAYVFFLLFTITSQVGLLPDLDGAVAVILNVLDVITKCFVGTHVAAAVDMTGTAADLILPAAVGAVTLAASTVGGALLYRHKELK